MSLVSEALKKAEREAAAREARQRGQPAPPESPRQPYRAPRQRRSFAPWLLLFAALAIVGVMVLKSSSGEFSKDEEAPATEEPKSVSGSASPAPTSVPSTTGTSVPGAAPAPETEVASPPSERNAREPADPASSSSGAGSGPSRTPTSERELVPAPAPAPPAGTAAGRSREYVREVALPDGSKLTLGGIAYSESAPFAYLNGKLLKVGEGTAGYTLTRIERDRVAVRGESGELVIRLKPR